MKKYLREKIISSLTSLGIGLEVPVVVERPRQPEHGDLTCNIAMVLAKGTARNPRHVAKEILQHMELDPLLIEEAETAGPGFINFKFTERFYRHKLKELLIAGNEFGRSNIGEGKKAQVEFVSANPTGPLTVGHGRNAVFGDAVANLLEWVGYDVAREYYFNNAGRQMRVLGDSVKLRYLELLGHHVEFPESYYQGDYIREIARHVLEEHADGLRDERPEGKFKEQAEREIFDGIRKTLRILGVEFQSYFNENSLYEDGKIDEVIEELRRKHLVYESEGALWFRASVFGGEKDKVIVKSSGEPTYRLPDIAYHREKFRRGYDLIVDVFGSDHISTYPDVLAGLAAMGYDTQRVKVLIHQFVTLVQNGEVVKMSTRKANYVTLDELIEKVGADVVRYFFLMRSMSSHLNFDLGLAKQQSDENPVYYLQYAHARVSSIIRFAGKDGGEESADSDYDLLSTRVELELIKMLLLFPEMIESCALTFEPHRMAEYLQGVASAFHKFYHKCRVVSEDLALTKARLAVCRATRVVLRNGFSVLGIAAPEQM